MSMLGVGVIMMIYAVTGSYSTAGAIAAVTNISFAIAAPLSGRLVDRYGQRRMIIPLAGLNAVALITLMLCVYLGLPHWTYYVSGFVVGASSISLGSMVRARWSHLYAGSPRMHTAFHFESVADEVIFVTGPALATVLAAQVSPYAGLIVALVCMYGGSLAFALQRGTEPPVRPAHAGGGSPITIPGIALLAAVFLALGAIFGSIDLITVAFANEHGVAWAAGFLITAFAGGSMVSGIWFGSREWRVSLRPRFLLPARAFWVGLLPLPLVAGVWAP